MTDYKETKQLLENSNFYYILTTNMEGKYTYINNRYKKVFEGIHGKILGQPYYITMHPDDMSICQDVGAKCFQYPDKVFPATIRKHDGKGGFIITQWEYKALLNENGGPEGIFCIGYDITEFMNNNIRLRSALNTLDQQETTLREIAYNQSHIIRKPVANILGLGLVLENMEMDSSLKSLVNLIVESARELDDSIKTIVDRANN